LARVLTDEVWRQLDPRAGRLCPRTARRVRLAIAVLLVAVVAAELAWYAGLVVPRVSSTDESGYEYGWDPVHHSVAIRNDGLLPIQVLGVGRSGPGIRLDRVDGAVPSTVDPGGYVRVTLTFTIHDCAAVPAQRWPVPVEIERPWGAQTVYIDLPAKDDREGPEWSTGTRMQRGIEWQRWLADMACRYPN
jgi:hypothetical protein